MQRRSKLVSMLAAMTAMVIGCSASPSDPPPRPDSEKTTWVRTMVFGAQCRCHLTVEPYANLDLYSPGLEGRIVGRRSNECGNLMLVIPGDPDGSYLVRKLVDTTPACGRQMPLSSGLPEGDLQAVRDWVASLERP